MNLISERLFIIIAACNLKVIFGSALEQEGNFNLSTVELIEKYGYPAETHTTESKDGYRLTLHRIPHGKNSTKSGFPILAAHGIFSDSSQFVHHGNKSLGFLLADKGYDVWLINFRGNHYTRAHKYLSTEDTRFWDFSLHEQGIYDLPAYIDYICNYTKNHELFFLGYSMGTTAFLVLGSERPEYQKHIRGAVLLAPVSTMKYSNFSLRVLTAFGSILKVMSDLHLHGEFYIDPEEYQKFVEFSCASNSPISKFCEHAFFALTIGKFHEGSSGKLLSHYNSSTSTKVLAHYAQLFQSGKFSRYDYGILHNQIIYKHKLPPEYRLQSVTTPISFFVASNDFMATPKGVNNTLSVLTSVETIYVVPDKYFGHGIFISGKEIEETLYSEITRQIENLLIVSQEHSLNNTFKRAQDIENYREKDSFNNTPVKTHGSERDPEEHSLINTPREVQNNENYLTEHPFDSTPLNVHSGERDPLEHSLINTFKKVHGIEDYHTEDSFNTTPLKVHSDDGDLAEYSLINAPGKVHDSEDYPPEHSFNSTPLNVHSGERDPLEHSLINTFKKVHSIEDYHTEDSFNTTPLKVHSDDGDLAEYSLINAPGKVHDSEDYPPEHSFNSTPLNVYGSERDPEEHSFINTHKMVHDNENDSVDSLKDGFRKAHGRENDPARHYLINKFRKVHGRKHNHNHGEHYTKKHHHTH